MKWGVTIFALLLGAAGPRAHSWHVRAPVLDRPAEFSPQGPVPAGDYVLIYESGAVMHDPRRGFEVTERYIGKDGIKAGYHLLNAPSLAKASEDVWLDDANLAKGKTVAEVEGANAGHRWYFHHAGGPLFITHVDDFEEDNEGPGIELRLEPVEGNRPAAVATGAASAHEGSRVGKGVRRLCYADSGDKPGVECITLERDRIVSRTRISGPNTQLVAPSWLSVDPVHGELFVVNCWDCAHFNQYPPREWNYVTVYPLAANGDVAPLRRISGRAEQMPLAQGIVVDPVHDELYIGTGSEGAADSEAEVLVVPRTANGPVSPVRVLRGRGLNRNGPADLALDLVHGELWVADLDGFHAFARTATGDAAPVRELRPALSAGSQRYSPLVRTDRGILSGTVSVDTVHDELIVAGDQGGSGSAVRVFARTASGEAAPRRVIHPPRGSAWPEVFAGVAEDLAADELVVISRSSLLVYPRTANAGTSEATPLRRITLPHEAKDYGFKPAGFDLGD